MSTVGAYEAKTHLPQLLKRVAGGERITITKHGVPVAILVPPETNKQTPTREIISSLREFRQKHSLKGLSIKEMIEEGNTYSHSRLRTQKSREDVQRSII